MTPHPQPPVPELLVVEDSDEDFAATERALRKNGFTYDIRRCHDGEEALAYLTGRLSRNRQAPLPGLMILDLNLPGTDGREVLQEIKEHEVLRALPVVVFTTSSDERDIQHCYRAGANSYIQKPVGLDGLFGSIRRLIDYWFDIVILPRESRL